MFCQTCVVSEVMRSAPLATRRLDLSVTVGEQIKNLAKLLTDLSQGRALFAGLLGCFRRSGGGAEPRGQRRRRLQASGRRFRHWRGIDFVAGSAAAVVG